MPWVLVLRWVVRLAVSLAFWRMFTARRGSYNAGAPPLQRRRPNPHIDPAVAALAIREGAAVGWRLLALVVFLVAAGVLATAGVTTTVLSPRWLGGILLALTAFAIAAAAFEMRALVRLLSARRRRLHDQELRRQLS